MERGREPPHVPGRRGVSCGSGRTAGPVRGSRRVTRRQGVRPRRSSMPIATVNPTTGETLKTFEPLGPDGIEERVAKADRAFRAYRGTDFASRSALLASAA